MLNSYQALHILLSAFATFLALFSHKYTKHTVTSALNISKQWSVNISLTFLKVLLFESVR